MKRMNILIVGLLVLPLYGDISINQMETMVEKIKAKRVGSVSRDVNIVSSPFVSFKKEQNVTIMIDEKPVEKNITFVLGGIVNSKAFLNNTWVAVGDKINGFTLSKIENRGVTLVKGNKIIQVFLRQSKQILKISEG